MKNLILLFSLALMLSSCSLFRNKSKQKNKSSVDSSYFQKTKTAFVDTSKSVLTETTTSVSETPGKTSIQDFALSPYTQMQYNYLAKTFEELNRNTVEMQLTLDSASKNIRLTLHQPPTKTTTTTKKHKEKKNAIYQYRTDKKEGTFSKKSVNLSVETKPNIAVLVAVIAAACFGLWLLSVIINRRINS